MKNEFSRMKACLDRGKIRPAKADHMMVISCSEYRYLKLLEGLLLFVVLLITTSF